MGIREMVADGLGFVTDEDRAQWDAHREAIRKEAEAESSGLGKALTTGVTGSLMQAADTITTSMVTAEQVSTADKRRRRRVITEEVEAEYDEHGNEMEF